MRFVGSAKECMRRLRELTAEGDALYEIRTWKRGRSLNQNAYYWELLGLLGEALGYPKDELHRHMLREYGCYDVFTVRDDVPLADYFRYWDVVGEGDMDGRHYLHVRAFKGSSEMDSTEFSHLLNGVIQECEQQGINTMTPQEAARLKWIGGE